ncbi:transposable element Tcb1 transposase [Trichonephila clavipes]|nr:transposable element Tcb1 transposase [Trichonephila clavipes]
MKFYFPHVRLFRGAVGDKFVFMDDNATCHRTLAVQDCLDSVGIQRLVWPARSPDLNPIENVWDALGRQVAGRNYPPTNKNTLIRALTEEWDKLPLQLLDNVVQSMDEVEKLAYQLNEEAERTERPIRRLSKVMYGSTCADMQGRRNGECLSSIKHVVGARKTGGRQWEKSLDTRHRRLDADIAFYRGQKTARWWSVCTMPCTRCVPLTPAHRRRRSLQSGNTGIGGYNEWGRVLFTDEEQIQFE